MLLSRPNLLSDAGAVADFGAVRRPASRWLRLVRGVELALTCWVSSMVEIFGGGATLSRLIWEPLPRLANPGPDMPIELLNGDWYVI